MIWYLGQNYLQYTEVIRIDSIINSLYIPLPMRHVAATAGVFCN